jgi:signal transduction histidine kinase
VNLIVNAIQAMPEGGTLTLGTSRQRGWVRLFVADDGIGMNDETLRQIFEPFFTTKEAGHGTGLGLGIVQNIIATLGGTLAVESQPGRGSRFTLEMPVGDQVEPRERQHE